MIGFPEALEFWHWWIAGVLLLGLELLVPGTFFLWMGAAAGIVGAVLLFLPNLAWQVQLLTFAVLSVCTIFGWRKWQKEHPTATDHPLLNRRAEQNVGRVITLDQALVNGRGRMMIDGTLWEVVAESGFEYPVGTRMRVIGSAGGALIIGPV